MPRAPRRRRRRDAFIDRLCALRILDPACGSGNFLYLALQAVKDIEYRAILECETLGLGMVVPRVGAGNPARHRDQPVRRRTRAHDDLDRRHPMAGEQRHHPPPAPDPAQARLDRMPRRAADGGRARRLRRGGWPEADFIFGNPPFLGGKLLRRGLGDEIVEALFRAYEGRVPAEADLVCYWFAKAWEAVQAGRAKRVGLVATNSIRGGANRKVLEPIAEAGAIFEAWSDEPWTIDGAAVRVSWCALVKPEGGARLDAAPVDRIHADLSAEILEPADGAAIAGKRTCRIHGRHQGRRLRH